MEYSTATPHQTVSTTKLAFASRPTAPLTGPDDLKSGFLNTIWFTAKGGVGVMQATTGKVRPLAHPSGRTPARLCQATGGGFWFTDPSGNAIGRVHEDGRYAPDIDCGPDSRPQAISPEPALVGAYAAPFRTAELVGLEPLTKLSLPRAGVTAISYGPGGLIWYVADGTLGSVDRRTGAAGPSLRLPEGAHVDRLAYETVDHRLYYTDEGRDVVGCVKDEFSVVEYRLEPNTRPRDVCIGDGRSIWFITRNGRAVANMKGDRMAEYEVTGVDQPAFTRMALVGSTLWCSEQAHSRISFSKLKW